MNKRGLMKEIQKVVVTQREARLVVDRIFKTIQTALRHGEKVVISGFGTFRPQLFAAKITKNPKTGKEMHIPPHRRVKFKPAKTLLKRDES